MLTVTKKYDLPGDRARFELDAELAAMVLDYCAAIGTVWNSGPGRARMTKTGRVTVTAKSGAHWTGVLTAFGGLEWADEWTFARIYQIPVICIRYAAE